jgi:hypothetical protein
MKWRRKKLVRPTPPVPSANIPAVPSTNIPAYVDRERGAAELSISPELWDEWVTEGRLPPPAPGFPPSVPRWRWEEVDLRMSGDAHTTPPESPITRKRRRSYVTRPKVDPFVEAVHKMAAQREEKKRRKKEEKRKKEEEKRKANTSINGDKQVSGEAPGPESKSTASSRSRPP